MTAVSHQPFRFLFCSSMCSILLTSRRPHFTFLHYCTCSFTKVIDSWYKLQMKLKTQWATEINGINSTLVHIIIQGKKHSGLPRRLSGKESTCQCSRRKRHGFDPWVRKIPWSRRQISIDYLATAELKASWYIPAGVKRDTSHPTSMEGTTSLIQRH